MKATTAAVSTITVKDSDTGAVGSDAKRVFLAAADGKPEGGHRGKGGDKQVETVSATDTAAQER